LGINIGDVTQFTAIKPKGQGGSIADDWSWRSINRRPLIKKVYAKRDRLNNRE
jgi:hypothetical protein